MPSPSALPCVSTPEQLARQLRGLIERHLMLPSDERASEEEVAKQARQLLEAGADPQTGNSLLIDALASYGNGPLLSLVLEFCPPLPAQQLSRLMGKAVVSHQRHRQGPAAVGVLLKYGADPLGLTESASSHLHNAVLFNQAALPLLLAAGGSPDVKDDEGNTPLHVAAWSLRLEAAQCLLGAGANPLLLNTKGQTPLARFQEYEQKKSETSKPWVSQKDGPALTALLRAAEHSRHLEGVHTPNPSPRSRV